MCPALHYPPRPLQKTCHCEPVTDVTGAAIRTSLRRAALAGRGRTSASTAFGASGRRPLRSSIGKRFVGVGLPDDPHRTCTKLLALRRAGCPQPAARQPLHPPGRARGPCPTKILRITPGGQGRPPLRRNVLQGGTHVSRRTPHPLQKTLSLAWQSVPHGLQLPAASPAVSAPDRGMQQLLFLQKKQIFGTAGARPAHPFIVKKPTGLFVS